MVSPKIAKGKRRDRGDRKKTIMQSTYHLRNRTLTGEVDELKGKELALLVKKARQKEKSYQTSKGKKNSIIVLSETPSDVEVEIDSDYG